MYVADARVFKAWLIFLFLYFALFGTQKISGRDLFAYLLIGFLEMFFGFNFDSLRIFPNGLAKKMSNNFPKFSPPEI